MKKLLLGLVLISLLSGCSSSTQTVQQPLKEVPEETQKVIEDYCQPFTSKKERRCKRRLSSAFQNGAIITKENIDKIYKGQ